MFKCRKVLYLYHIRNQLNAKKMAKAEFKKNQKVNYYGEEATILKVSETPNLNGWFTYSVKYYPLNGEGQRLRHGQSHVEQHEIKAL